MRGSYSITAGAMSHKDPSPPIAIRNIPSYDRPMPSRPVGRLLDLEYRIIEASLDLERDGNPVYGFALARQLSSSDGDQGLIGHGTLYKALGRLSTLGLMESTWEVPTEEEEGRPRRRLYRVTGEGAKAAAARPLTARVSPAARSALA